MCIPLRAAELVELAAVGEDDERDLGVAEHGELVRLLEQAVAALGEGDLAVDLVLDPLQLNPSPPHDDDDLSSSPPSFGFGSRSLPPADQLAPAAQLGHTQQTRAS